MRYIDSAGNAIDARLELLERRLDSPLKAIGFGVLMGLLVVALGIASFLFVLFVLVNMFA